MLISLAAAQSRFDGQCHVMPDQSRKHLMAIRGNEVYVHQTP